MARDLLQPGWYWPVRCGQTFARKLEKHLQIAVIRVDVSREHQGGAGVAEIVEAYLPEACLLEEVGQRPLPEVRGIYGRPRRGYEDEAPVFVAVAEVLDLVHLPLEVGHQRFRGILGQVYPPAPLLGPGFPEVEPSVLEKRGGCWMYGFGDATASNRPGRRGT